MAREIKANRTKLPPEYHFGNDCKLARYCEKKHMCGTDPEACDEKCKKCKGQPLTHNYAEHENELPVCLRSLYNYIDAGELAVKDIDLRRKVGYKRCRKKNGEEPKNGTGILSQEYRQGRGYGSFENDMGLKFSGFEVIEMDTVKGVRENAKAH